MALSSLKVPYETIAGCFRHAETGKDFEYRKSAGNHCGMPHEVFVGPGEGYDMIRYAKVLKTVAYVVVDEDDYGAPVIEKWPVKSIWARAERGANFNDGF